MKPLALAFAAALSAPAWASFELALVYQSYTPVGTSGGRAITRWDPLNGISLGQFYVNGFTDPTIALNRFVPGTIDAFGRQGGGLQILRYDYSTGVLNNTINTGIAVTSVNDLKYLTSTSFLMTGNFGGTRLARMYTTGGSLQRTFSNPAGTLEVMSAIQDAAGYTYTLTRSAGTVSNSKYALNSYNVGSGAIAGTLIVADNTTLEYSDLMLAGGYIGFHGGTMGSKQSFTVNGINVGAGGQTGGWSTLTDTMSLGHTDVVHGFGYDASQSRMAFSTGRMSFGSGDTFRYINSTVYGTVYDSAIVVAPEPGTMIAVGVGIAALLRKRKKA